MGKMPADSRGATVWPGAGGALGLLLAINLLNYADRYVLAAVVPQLRRAFFGPSGGGGFGALTGFMQSFQKAFGFRPENALIGSLSMAFMVVYLLAAPLFGKWAERARRWWLIGLGVSVWSLASGASGLAGSFVILFLTRCAVGIGEAAYGPVAPALISDFFPIARRGRVMAWFYMAIPVGSALGFVLGDQIARTALGWRWAFFLVAPPGLLLGILSFLKPEPPRGAAESDPRAGQSRSIRWRDYAVLIRTPSYVLNTLGMSAMTFALGGIAFWMVDYVVEKRHVHGPAASIFGGITVLAGLVGTLLGGWAGDALRPVLPGAYFIVSGVAMLLGFPLFLGVLFSPFPLAWVWLFLASACLFFNTGPTNTILANVTHPAIRAAGFALNILVIHALGDVLSPLVIGAITDRANMTIAFLAVAVMILAGGALWLWGARYLEDDTEKAAERFAAAQAARAE